MVRQTIANGLRDNLSSYEIADQLSESYAFSDERAQLIADTETQFANGRGNVEGLKEANKHGLKTLVEWICDPDPCEDCEENQDEGPIPPGEAFPSGDVSEPVHPNCFLGHTLILATESITAQFKRWFSGKIIVISISGNNDLSVTPNHPILTDNGWVAAGALKNGDYVAKLAKPSTIRESIIGDPTYYNMPTRIDEVAASLLMSGSVLTTSVPTAAVDFHGDGVAHSKVDIIYSAGFLRSNLNPACLKKYFSGHFYTGYLWAALKCFCSPFKIFNTTLATSDCSVSRCRVSKSLFWSLLGSLKKFCLALPAYFQSCRTKNLADVGMSAADNPSNIYAAFAGQIEFVKISEIRNEQFSGHVYNLSTVNHWYTAENIIVHNCRCYTQGVVEEDGEEDSATDDE